MLLRLYVLLSVHADVGTRSRFRLSFTKPAGVSCGLFLCLSRKLSQISFKCFTNFKLAKMTKPKVVLNQESSPFDVILWVKRQYSQSQVVMTTSFGMEGCALIDMLDRSEFSVTISNIDTGFLFTETRELRDRIKLLYNRFHFETWHPEFTAEEQARDYGDRLWARDPSLCCQLRKVRPLEQNIDRFQVWITGIRRSQSASRQSIAPVQWDWRYNILKVCPLANWQRRDVWRYVDDHDVPHNKLHKQGYPTVGCTHCTRKVEGLVKLTGYSRAGRWSNHEKTECGLHFDEPSTANFHE